MAKRRRSGRGGGHISQIVLISALAGLLIFLVGGLVWLFVKGRTEYIPRDQASLCPLTGYTSQTLVLVDTTDALASVTQVQLLQKLKDVVASVPKNGLLELRLLNADVDRSLPVMKALCNPGDGSDIDPVTGNPEMAKHRWQAEYLDKVEDALASSVGGSEQDYSPIMEVIQRMAAEHLTSAHDRAIPSRLIIVSDMIQHTTEYSHYRDGVTMDTFDRVARRRLATDLAQATVDFWMVRRATQKVDPEHLGASGCNGPVTAMPSVRSQCRRLWGMQ